MTYKDKKKKKQTLLEFMSQGHYMEDGMVEYTKRLSEYLKLDK